LVISSPTAPSPGRGGKKKRTSNEKRGGGGGQAEATVDRAVKFRERKKKRGRERAIV